MDQVMAEYGVTGVVVMCFVGLLAWFKTFINNLLNNEMQDIQGNIKQNREILVKLIDRFGRTDDLFTRRTEELMKELNEVTDNLNYLSGKMNGGRR
jgi:hypothetical protein